jgi:hypothetical protein
MPIVGRSCRDKEIVVSPPELARAPAGEIEAKRAVAESAGAPSLRPRRRRLQEPRRTAGRLIEACGLKGAPRWGGDFPPASGT